MNKAHLMIAAFSLVMGAILLLPALNIAYAQYSAPGASSGSLEEQLKLAKEKISNAQQKGAYGSGTAMFGTNIDSTVIMIIVIAVIIGGVAAAFFVASTSAGRKKHVQAAYSGSSSGGSGTFCTNCGAPAGNTKFCGNCGAKL
jgi:membrane protease subunit (stomatin/prohibitin family)